MRTISLAASGPISATSASRAARIEHPAFGSVPPDAAARAAGRVAAFGDPGDGVGEARRVDRLSGEIVHAGIQARRRVGLGGGGGQADHRDLFRAGAASSRIA